MPTSPLAEQTLRQAIPRLVDNHRGQWAVVKDDQILKLTDDLGDALDCMYDHGGPDAVLVDRVLTEPPRATVSSLYVPPG